MQPITTIIKVGIQQTFLLWLTTGMIFFFYISNVIKLFFSHFRFRFLYINVGSPGRCNDSQIYETSNLKKHLVENPLLKEMERNISGINVPVLLIGDSAFRLSRNMMKPYPFSVFQDDQKQTFNYIHAKNRRVVENAFGHLKARFRRIGKGIDNDIGNASVIIKACCVLHNFLNERNDEVSKKWLAAQEQIDSKREQPNQAVFISSKDGDAEEIREAIAAHLGK